MQTLLSIKIQDHVFIKKNDIYVTYLKYLLLVSQFHYYLTQQVCTIFILAFIVIETQGYSFKTYLSETWLQFFLLGAHTCNQWRIFVILCV